MAHLTKAAAAAATTSRTNARERERDEAGGGRPGRWARPVLPYSSAGVYLLVSKGYAESRVFSVFLKINIFNFIHLFIYLFIILNF
jgi:hypothetical protein